MPAPDLTPEDKAWLLEPRKRSEFAKRFPHLFAHPATSGDVAQVVDKLDEIIVLLRRLISRGAA